MVVLAGEQSLAAGAMHLQRLAAVGLHVWQTLTCLDSTGRRSCTLTVPSGCANNLQVLE